MAMGIVHEYLLLAGLIWGAILVVIVLVRKKVFDKYKKM